MKIIGLIHSERFSEWFSFSFFSTRKLQKGVPNQWFVLQKTIKCGVRVLQELHRRRKELEEENENHRSKCVLLDQVRLDDRKFQFWTGFPNYEIFTALFNYLEGVGAIGRMRHWRGSEMFSKDPYPKKAARIAKLTPEEELFMVLVRLRVGLTITDLALRFGISESSVSKIFTSWINLLFFHLKDLCEMSECEMDGKAKQFSKFPCLKVIIDSTEILT